MSAKKLATRQALGAAALRLAVERGIDNVLVEDITAEANVSPRTFNNYFSSKLEAMCALGMDRAGRIGAALRERPASEPSGRRSPTRCSSTTTPPVTLPPRNGCAACAGC